MAGDATGGLQEHSSGDTLQAAFVAVRDLMREDFSAGEVRELCLVLGGNPNDIFRQNARGTDNIDDLLAWAGETAERRATLIARLRVLRPTKEWPNDYRFPGGPERSRAPAQPPPPREGEFVGREADMAWLRGRLLGAGSAAVAGVGGTGGIGKSEVAKALAADETLRARFGERVAWVDCGANAPRDVQALLAAHFGVELRADENETVRGIALNQALQKQPATLIILDDVRTAHKAAFAALRPPAPPHALLVTTRLAGVLPDAATRMLDELDDAAARQLLAAEIGAAVKLDDDPAAVADIVALTEGLPQAIILAGRWLRNQMQRRKVKPARPLAALRDALRARRPVVLDQDTTNRELSLRMAFDLSYDELSEDDQRRLRRLGVFGRRFFYLNGLVAVWDEDETAARRGVLALEEAGLLQPYDEDAWWLHDVLRDYARERLLADPAEAADAARWQARYVEWTLDNTTVRSLDDWAWLAGFRPEIERAGAWLLANWEQEPEQAAGLAVLLGNKLYSDPTAAPVGWLRAGLGAARAAERPEYEASIAGSLGFMLRSRGQYNEAEQLYRISLAVFEGLGDSRGVAVTQSSLAGLLSDRGQYEEAEQLYRASVEVFEGMGDSLNLAATHLSLADLLWQRGQYNEAERLYRMSLVVFEELRDSRSVAGTQASLADLLRNRGQYDEAERLYRASLAVLERLGDSRSVAVTQSSLAGLLLRRGQYDEAERLYQVSLAVKESLGDSRGVAVTQSALADLLMQRGQYEEAERLYQTSLLVFKGLGDSREVAVTQSSLAGLLLTRGQYVEAEPLYRASLAVFERLGDSRSVAITQTSLAHSLMDRGQYDEAERLYRTSMVVTEGLGDSREVKVTQSALASLLKRRGQYDEAERLYRASMAVAEDMGDSRGLAVSQSALADLLMTLGQFDEAERLYQAGLDTTINIRDLQGVAVIQMGLGQLALSRGERETARDWLRKAQTGFATLGLTTWEAQVDELLALTEVEGLTVADLAGMVRAARAGDRAAGLQAWDIAGQMMASGDATMAALGDGLQRLLAGQPAAAALAAVPEEWREPLLKLLAG